MIALYLLAVSLVEAGERPLSDHRNVAPRSHARQRADTVRKANAVSDLQQSEERKHW